MLSREGTLRLTDQSNRRDAFLTDPIKPGVSGELVSAVVFDDAVSGASAAPLTASRARLKRGAAAR